MGLLCDFFVPFLRISTSFVGEFAVYLLQQIKLYAFFYLQFKVVHMSL